MLAERRPFALARAGGLGEAHGLADRLPTPTAKGTHWDDTDFQTFDDNLLVKFNDN